MDDGASTGGHASSGCDEAEAAYGENGVGATQPSRAVRGGDDTSRAQPADKRNTAQEQGKRSYAGVVASCKRRSQRKRQSGGEGGTSAEGGGQ